MPIPKIQNVPTKHVTLPLAKKKVKIRPFLVKEEKLLIMARESEGEDTTQEYISAMQQIIDACSHGQLDAETLSQPDLEYIFIQIRMMSKGNISKFQYRCLEEVDDPDNEGEKKQCGTLLPVKLDLSKIELKKNEDHKSLFKIPNNNIHIQMKYPSIALSAELEKQGINQDNIENMKWSQIEYLIISCIDSIIEGDENQADTYNDFTKEELSEWLETVPSETLEDIVTYFFSSIPHLEHTIEVTCHGCGAQHKIPVRGLENFFD